MPGLSGIEALEELKQDDPGVKLVFLTMHRHVAYAHDVFHVSSSLLQT